MRFVFQILSGLLSLKRLQQGSEYQTSLLLWMIEMCPVIDWTGIQITFEIWTIVYQYSNDCLLPFWKKNLNTGHYGPVFIWLCEIRTNKPTIIQNLDHSFLHSDDLNHVNTKYQCHCLVRLRFRIDFSCINYSQC